MRRRTRVVLFASGLLFISSAVFAQTSPTAGLTTPLGHEFSVTFGGYNYVEPGDQNISIHGPKIGGEYTGTFAISKSHHWFAQGNFRAIAGKTTYDGWCSPYLIEPNSGSPNGYLLNIGDASPCSETGDSDWYIETRGLIGKDFAGRKIGWSPYAGIGYRHLSNGTTGTPGYRIDDYLYLPLGITARTQVASHHELSFNFEFGPLLRGWQNTYDSALGGGDVPATPIAPAFTINGFSDFAFSQHSGFTLRLSGKYQLARHVLVEPYYIRWNVSSSPDSTGTATFTVNGITAQEQFGAFEPKNFTNEFGVKFGFRF